MDDRTLKIVKAMATYQADYTDAGSQECAFCSYEEYGKGHEEGCPVLAAQQIIAELSNEPQA